MLYKIIFQRYISIGATAFFFHVSPVWAQEGKTGKYEIAVMGKIDEYQQAINREPAKKMIELRTVVPRVVYDLKYATTQNFMHRCMYTPPTRFTFLRAPAAQALAQVQKELQQKGLGLKIFDAYRPYSVTVTFWQLVHDERYVANPSKGSGHNRGLAVDLTIIDLKTGKELDMGTGFDNFSDTAHHSFTNLPPVVLQNRRLLKETMAKYGFNNLETEWWHYFWPNDKGYEVLDVPFEELVKRETANVKRS